MRNVAKGFACGDDHDLVCVHLMMLLYSIRSMIVFISASGMPHRASG